MTQAAMSAASHDKPGSPRPETSLAGLLDSRSSQWLLANRRRAVPSVEVMQTTTTPSRLLELPEWPGSGRMKTVTDDLPLVTIADMPANRYPQYVRPLVGYTIAELAMKYPHLASQVWDSEVSLQVMLAVAARVGVWASLNRAPEAPESITGKAVRWSERAGTLVVRPATLDDGSALWRHFLASSPGLPKCAAEICPAIAGVAPLLFLAGSALLLQAGEVYAMRYLEVEVTKHLRTVLSRDALAVLNLDSESTWDTLTAAAIGGYSVSVIRAVASDPAYVVCAYLRCGPDVRLSSQLERLASAAPRSYYGFPDCIADSAPVPAAAPRAFEDDAVSVVDTEAEYGDDLPFNAEPEGTITPVPDLAPGVREELVGAIRRVQPMTPAVRSIARMPAENESIVW